MQLKTIRLDAADASRPNLFWIVEGRAYHTELTSETAARVLRFLEELLPFADGSFVGAEECFLVSESGVESVRQIGAVPIGNVRLWSKRVRKFLADGL